MFTYFDINKGGINGDLTWGGKPIHIYKILKMYYRIIHLKTV